MKGVLTWVIDGMLTSKDIRTGIYSLSSSFRPLRSSFFHPSRHFFSFFISRQTLGVTSSTSSRLDQRCQVRTRSHVLYRQSRHLRTWNPLQIEDDEIVITDHQSPSILSSRVFHHLAVDCWILVRVQYERWVSFSRQKIKNFRGNFFRQNFWGLFHSWKLIFARVFLYNFIHKNRLFFQKQL